MANTTPKCFRPKQDHQSSLWYELGIEDELTSRSTAVRLGFKPIVYRNVAKRAKLSESDFSAITLIPISTIKRRIKNDERFSTQESDAIYRLVLLIKAATDLFGDEQRALEWLQTAVYGLNGKRPLDMLTTTADFEIVQNLIGQIEHGVFA